MGKSEDCFEKLRLILSKIESLESFDLSYNYESLEQFKPILDVLRDSPSFHKIETLTALGFSSDWTREAV